MIMIARLSRGKCRFGFYALLLCSSLFLSTACNTVEFYEMESFTDPALSAQEGPARNHFRQKVLYSMEGSAGGVGSSAGGGCGCY